MLKKTIRDINIRGKRVLVRVDYNVSLHSGKISDDLRIRQTLPTLEYLLGKKCRIILMSHLDDPGGRYQKSLSLRPVAKDLEKLLGKKVVFSEKYLSAEEQKKVVRESQKNIVLLENLRFFPQEEANDQEFSRQLANLGEIFIQDGFGVCHRKHASVVGVPKYLPAVAGFLLEKEADIILKTLSRPKHPFVGIVGGAKTETKINLLDELMEKADVILLGGCIGITFLKAKGLEIGRSKYDKKAVELAKKLLAMAKEKKVKFILPLDSVLGNLKTDFIDGVVLSEGVDKRLQILDIGPKTEAAFGREIAKAKTVIWTGPMGYIEKKEYRRGTDFIFYAVSQNKQAVSIVGGGDTISALSKLEYLKGISHLSTGGGAMLQFIEQKTLPGIEVLQNK
jgi:phosphoglycerate kinase